MSRDNQKLAKLISRAPTELRVNLWRLATALTIPPDASHITHGLAIVEGILTQIKTHLDERLDFNDTNENGLSPGATLIHLCKTMSALVAAANFAAKDTVHHPMVRDSSRDRTPLHGYYVDDCPVWVMLFYVADPALGEEVTERYRWLLELVFTELIILTLSVDHTHYSMRIAAMSRTSKEKDERSTEPQDPFACPLIGAKWSRIRETALVLRNFSDPTLNDLLFELTDDTSASSLAGVALRLEPIWKDELKIELKDFKGDSDEKKRIFRESKYERFFQPFARVLDLSNPGWRSKETKIGAGGSGPKSTRRKRTSFGFIRLPESQTVIDRQPIDDMIELQHLITPIQSVDRPSDENSKTLSEFDESPIDDPARSSAYDLLLVKRSHPAGSSSSAVAGSMIGRQIKRHYALLSTRKSALSPLQVSRLRQSLTMPIETPEDRIFQTFARAALSTGRTLGNDEFKIVRVLDDVPEKATPRTVYFSLSEQKWVLFPAPPAFVDAAPLELERPLASRLFLDDALDFHSLASIIFNAKVDQLGGVRVPWSASNKGTALEEFQRIIDDKSASLQSLEKLLFERLVICRNGDTSIATLLTDQSVGHSRTVVHYSNLSVDDVVETYAEALAPFQLNERLKKPAISARHIGARRVPTRDSVRELITALTEKFQSDSTEVGFNAYGVYNLIAFQISCAARPVIHRVLPRSSSIFPQVRLNEKAVSSYHERITFLPQLAVVQLGHYAEFINRSAPAWISSEGLFPYFNSKKFVDGELTPSRFSEIATSVGFPLELYSLRRFVRTELMSRLVAGEDIDGFMGHWFHQCSPFDPLSLYPPRRLLKLAEESMTKVLIDVGFTGSGQRL